MRVEMTGVLAKKFGSNFVFAGKSAKECISALVYQLDGFEKYAMSVNFNAWIDDANVRADQLNYSYAEHSVLRLGLHVTGAGGNTGLLAVIAGVALIAVAWWNPAGWVVGTQMLVGGLGAGIAIMGAGQMMMPKAKMTDTADNKASYGFGSLNTTVEQGNCVPLLLGKGLIGGFVIMYRITTEDI